MRQKKRFIAEHFKTGQEQVFEFYSLEQAKYFNPYFINWREDENNTVSGY